MVRNREAITKIGFHFAGTDDIIQAEREREGEINGCFMLGDAACGWIDANDQMLLATCIRHD